MAADGRRINCTAGGSDRRLVPDLAVGIGAGAGDCSDGAGSQAHLAVQHEHGVPLVVSHDAAEAGACWSKPRHINRTIRSRRLIGMVKIAAKSSVVKRLRCLLC
jgi:hypothetical protein